MPAWMTITLASITSLYVITWIVFAFLCATAEEDGQVNPLSFWRANTRLMWRVIWTALQIKRIRWRAAQDQTRKELLDEHERQKQELVKWAFKDPKSFLGQ